MEKLYQTNRNAYIYIKTNNEYQKNFRDTFVLKGTKFIGNNIDNSFINISGTPKFYLKTEDIDETISKPSNDIAILMYHFFYDSSKGEAKRDYNHIDKNIFSEQMKYLYDHKYNVINLNEMMEYLNSKETLPKNTIVITVDDCSVTAYRYAFPILQAFNFKATFFMITETVKNNTNDTGWHITEEMYLDMKKSGLVNFESHSNNAHKEDNGQSHLLSMNNEEITKDLQESINYLKVNNIFCYPYGQYNDNLIKVLKKLKFKGAVTTNIGKVNKKSNPYALPRIRVEDTMSIEDFIAVINN